MILIEFPEQTNIIAKDQPEYLPMPAYICPNQSEGRIICCWKLSIVERIKLLFRGKIWHHILTFRNPAQPQLLEINKPLF
jgi:hypothetical protein